MGSAKSLIAPVGKSNPGLYRGRVLFYHLEDSKILRNNNIKIFKDKIKKKIWNEMFGDVDFMRTLKAKKKNRAR